MAVTSNQPACPGESVAVQCTVRGDVLTWHTPDGVLNLLRDRQEEGNCYNTFLSIIYIKLNIVYKTMIINWQYKVDMEMQ